MIAVGSRKVIRNFKSICNRTIKEEETIIITRPKGKNVVLLGEKEYNNTMENFRIFSSIKRYNKIKSGINQIENNQYTVRKLYND